MKHIRDLWLCLVVILFTWQQATAIPAFARRYKISCSTCHAPFPKLKPYGDDFAASGFILKEDDKDRDYIIAGDDLLRINKDFPIAARFDAFGVFEPDGDVSSDLQTPFGIKLFSGGALYKNIGYYFYFYMSERGEVSGIEDAYIHFDNLFGTEFDVMVGQFQVCDPLMKRELRLTYEDYQIYRSRVGRSYNNLTYDRGIMLTYGIEKTGTDLAAIIVNGNGKRITEDKFDRDKDKHIGLRLAQSLFSGVEIGGFYFFGKEAYRYGRGVSINKVTYYGPDLRLSFGHFEFTGQYLIREDTKPFFFSLVPKTKTTGIVGELIYAPQLDRSRWFFTALYNRIDSDIDKYEVYLKDFNLSTLGYHTATVSATYLLSRNLRLMGEYTRDLENDANRFVLGMLTAY